MKEGSLLQDLSTGVFGITGKVSEDYFNFSYLQHFSLPYIGGRLVGTICEYVLLGVRCCGEEKFRPFISMGFN